MDSCAAVSGQGIAQPELGVAQFGLDVSGRLGALAVHPHGLGRSGLRRVGRPLGQLGAAANVQQQPCAGLAA